MIQKRLLGLWLWLIVITLQVGAKGDIPTTLYNKLHAYPISSANYSVHVQQVGSAAPMVSWNSSVSRSPASVIKLLTTYSALLSLGYDYRWETQFYHTGYIRKGVLRGDIIVKASGDPTLATENLPGIVSQLKALGVQKVLGNIVIDRTLFRVPNKNNSGFDQNIYSPYNAMPDAIMFNERKSTLCITPSGRSVHLDRIDNDASYKIVNNLQMVSGSCRGNQSWPRVSIKTDTSQRSTIFLSGKLSTRCGPRTVCKVVSMPHRSFYYALKEELENQGIYFNGTLKLNPMPKSAHYLFSHYSDTLENIISTIAKESNNVMARQVLLTLGSKFAELPSTTFKGAKAVEEILGRYNILKGETFIANGSGLSRRSRLTAQSLANLLDHAALHYGDRWMNTLSIAGVDGTIKRRFAHSSVCCRAWMKTGTIRNVANIAGYVEGASGEKYVVVVLVNDKYAARYGRKLADSVIEWVANSL